MSPPPKVVENLPWIVVGFGRVGRAISLLSVELERELRGIWNRSPVDDPGLDSPQLPRPRSGPLPQALAELLQEPALIWLTVADDAIEELARSLVDAVAPGSLLVHTSGSLSSDIIGAGATYSVASLHPLQAITTPREAVERFPHSTWTVEGDDRAVQALEALMQQIGVTPLRIKPADKVLYHASAVCAANLLVSLFDAAISIAEAANIDADRARQMLVQLGQSSLENLRRHPPEIALTGPASRGDLATIERHREALRLRAHDDPQLLEIYELLTDRALTRLARPEP